MSEVNSKRFRGGVKTTNNTKMNVNEQGAVGQGWKDK